MNRLYKVLLIWGGVILGVFLIYATSPMDGSASRQDGKLFAFIVLGAIIGTVKVLRGRQSKE